MPSYIAFATKPHICLGTTPKGSNYTAGGSLSLIHVNALAAVPPMVGSQGFEPWLDRLRVYCNTAILKTHKNIGASGENRTLVPRLKVWYTTIVLLTHKVEEGRY